jgi:hypothetical protein
MKYILLGGCEIIFEGTKQECINRYKSFPSPLPMRLCAVSEEQKIFKDLSLNRVVVGDVV